MNQQRKNVNYYLSLPYTLKVVREDENTWFARVEELSGCITEAGSAEEATEMILDAMAAWIEIALEDGYPIPEPRSDEAFSGKFVVRVPRSLHRDLVGMAAQEGASLNQYINTELARSVGRADLMMART